LSSLLVNHDNICVVNESSLVKNLGGRVPVEFDFLVGMHSLEDVTPIFSGFTTIRFNSS